MMRSLSRFFAVGVLAAISGCSTSDSIDLVFADPVFEPKPPIGAAEMPTFRTGDIFRYRVGESLVAETVEEINAQGVMWRDSIGRRWYGSDRWLVPAQAVTNSSGKPQIIKASIESTGDLFPMAVGKTVAYRSTKANWLQGTVSQNRSCTVQDFGTINLAAGTFDAFKLKCQYDNAVRYNYYAPALGRVVLQTTDTLLDSVKRELIGFERGNGSALRTASGPTTASPTDIAKKMPRKAPKATENRYGVQLAAYRSSKKIKQVWGWLQRKGGALLADTKPSVERHEKNGKPLYRLIVGDFATKNQARAHCRSLKRKGVDCWARAHSTAAPSGPVAALGSGSTVNIVRR